MYAPALVAALPPAVLLAADTTSGSFDPLSLIGSVVTPVLVVTLLLAGKLHTHGELVRLEQANQQLRDQNATLQTALIERAVPALTRSTMVLEQIAPLIQAEVRLRPPRQRRES